MSARALLIVTNDFPPRQGGIQSFVHELARRLPAGQVAVYASDHPGAAAFDAEQDFPVRRHPSGMLLPTPGARRRVLQARQDFGSTSVWFGASAPLGLLAAPLRRAGVRRLVASTHGHEAGWAMLPVGRQALRRIGAEVDVVTYLAEYTRQRLAGAFGPKATLAQLTPGVDLDTFSPAVSGAAVRQRHGLTGHPVVVCVSRLVPRKGQDVLIQAMPAILAKVEQARLLIVGGGRYEQRLRALAQRTGVAEQVVFTGPVPAGELPEHFAAGDVFAMPCRTRRLGMDVEGLGIVFLEASASGLPVVAGNSGGAPETVRQGVTGLVVDGADVAAVADQVSGLLADPRRAAAMGAAGRQWTEQSWQWNAMADRLAELLRL
ncbi:MAG TPA: glycosyltransferase family 4 protein [Jatrophihabitans sp.]|jgi:phosphatidylinositol alpha-1,6-mannosyltransferase|uniref:glycosyltransferase family 4 protein n=1 Tax=Jatrophihabitans sp. TaxID=1932789 RepID=UPI002F179DF4